MSATNQLLDKDFVLRGDCLAVIPTPDGELQFAETTQVRGQFQIEEDTLEHTIMGRLQTVDREITKVSATVTFAVRELLSPVWQDLTLGQGSSQAIENYATLRRSSQMVRVKGTDQIFSPTPYGVPQDFDAVFWQPTIASSTPAAGAGFVNGNYHVWAVPVFVDEDVHRSRGFNLGSGVRGVDFVYGKPSADSPTSIASGPQDILVNFTVPLGSLPEPRLRPSGVAIIVNPTSGTISHAASRVAGYVPWSQISVGGPTEIRLTGMTGAPFGSMPQLVDLVRIEKITVTGGARAFTALVSGTDYTWSAQTGAYSAKAGGALASGDAVRISAWYKASPSNRTLLGSSNCTERVVPIRLYNLHGSTANPGTRLPVGGIIDIWEADIARVADEFITQAGKRFHTPITVTLPCNFVMSRNAIGQFESFSPEFAKLIDFYGPSVLPAPAPVAP
jgi:hypothetical protein